MVKNPGFIRKNGIATAVTVNPNGPAKVIDYEVLSNYCDSCAKAKKRKMTDDERTAFSEAHSSNYEGSSGGMESQGMLNIFHRSVDQYGIEYTSYLGDSDSKSFKTVSDAKPYANKVIQKLECCGHI